MLVVPGADWITLNRSWRGAKPARPRPLAPPQRNKEFTMLHYAVVFLVIALVAALFGFGGIAAGAAGIAKILFVLFVVLAVISLLYGFIRK
jgi:uncharacterized membrane protein YtjA (UPF0391 family)